MHPSISFLNNENTISSFEIEKSIKTFFVWYANLLTLKRDKRKIHPNVPRTGGVFLPCYKKIWKNSFNILLFSHTNYKWELILRKCEKTEFFACCMENLSEILFYVFLILFIDFTKNVMRNDIWHIHKHIMIYDFQENTIIINHIKYLLQKNFFLILYHEYSKMYFKLFSLF